MSFLAGLIFSFGLILSGMTLPHKVVGFLNVFREWDVTLAFVMSGAILVHGISYFLLKSKDLLYSIQNFIFLSLIHI